MRRPLGFVLGVVTGVCGAGIFMASTAIGQPAPRFEFIAETGAVVIGAGDTGDRVVVTGKGNGTTAAGTCGATPTTEYPSQYGVSIDPGGGRHTRMTAVIPLTATAFKPGTKLVNIALVSDCSFNGQAYQKFTGEEL